MAIMMQYCTGLPGIASHSRHCNPTQTYKIAVKLDNTDTNWFLVLELTVNIVNRV